MKIVCTRDYVEFGKGESGSISLTVYNIYLFCDSGLFVNI